MARSLRCGGCVAFLGLAFSAVYVSFPNWRGMYDQELAEAPNWLRSYVYELDAKADLLRRLGAVRTRLRAQDQICYELIDGQITLAEAVRRFGALPDPPDHFQDVLKHNFDGASDEERLGRFIIEWACNLLEHDPDRARSLRLGWEGELPKAADGGSRPTGRLSVKPGDTIADRVTTALAATEPQVTTSKDRFESGDRPITVEWFRPRGNGPHPAVLFLHESGGMHPRRPRSSASIAAG
jgi:hypothetical protein